MDKKLVLAAGLMTLVAGFVEAGICHNTTLAAVALSTEDASFVSKLSQDHAIAFNLMSADQRLEVLNAAHKGDLTPDAAVEGFMTQHHLAVIEGSLKTANIQ
ncbi:MAG: hypothetical protein ACRDFB_08385 [Rhabdochlamydiaceae bacterium]